MFAYIEEGGAAGSTCYNKFFLLYVRSWERTRGVGGNEGRRRNFWIGRRRGGMIL
jgi:hypothetical protein